MSVNNTWHFHMIGMEKYASTSFMTIPFNWNDVKQYALEDIAHQAALIGVQLVWVYNSPPSSGRIHMFWLLLLVVFV